MNSLLDYVSGREIVGGQEIVGQELTEVIGQVAQGVITQLAKVRAAGGVAVIEKDGSKKVKPLPFSTFAATDAAPTGNVECTAQELYRPSRLVLQDAVNWVVNSITITTKGQFAASGSTPGNLFAFNAWGVMVEFDTIPVGGKATMNVTKLTAGNLTLYSSFVGVSIG